MFMHLKSDDKPILTQKFRGRECCLATAVYLVTLSVFNFF